MKREGEVNQRNSIYEDRRGYGIGKLLKSLSKLPASSNKSTLLPKIGRIEN